MDFIPFLLDIIKCVVAAAAVVYLAHYVFKPYLDRNEQMQLMELKKSMSSQTLPLRLQAYERVVLFIERINPASMLLRLNGPNYTANELQSIIISEVRNEYQHNVTQQLYVNTRAWALVKQVKDDTLSMVASAVKALPDNASGLELSKTILAHLTQLQDNPYDIAINMIRTDIEQLF